MKIEVDPAPRKVRGFRFCGIHAGFKRKSRRDFAVIVADRPAACAAMFTRNQCPAAPVVVAREHAASGTIRAVFVNSGNANAGTGEAGLRLARWSCEEMAAHLSVLPQEVLPCSTGVIGVPIEKRTMSRAIAAGVDGLGPGGFGAAARAIMTSDEFPKWAERTVKGPQGPLTVVGMAKGAGMIHPDMATMLAFVMTDAALTPQLAQRILTDAAANSFNRISVDGDTSTNDTLLLIASGAAPGGEIKSEDNPIYPALVEAVGEVMDTLARMIVMDGEGATKIVDIVVEGAGSDDDARRAANTVATSPLVKAAFAGADPNWGRVLMALGNSGIEVNPATLSIAVGTAVLTRNGRSGSAETVKKARRIMRGQAFTVTVRLGDGPGTALVVTSDLTEAYVRFNSAYTS